MTFKPLRTTLLAAALAVAGAPAVAQTGAPGAAQPSATAAAPVSPAAAKARQQLDKLATEYYEALARFDPVSANFNGDMRFDDQIGMTISPKVRDKYYKRFGLWLTRLHAVDRSALDVKGQVNYDILNYELASALRLSAFPTHLLPLNQMESMPVNLAIFGSGQSVQRLVTPRDYKAYQSRLAQLPAWIDQAITNMRAGMKSGVTLPKATVTSMLPQFQKLVSATPEDSAYYAPIRNMPASFPELEKKRLAAEYRQLIDKKVGPAVARLATFLETEYLPAARTSTGWNALPNGREWYLASVAAQTTTDMKPDDIHATGLREVTRIQKEFAALGPKMGYRGQPAGLPQWVASQAKYKPFKSEQEVLEVYRKLDETLKAKLPTMFTLMPKTPLDVRPEPEITRETASDHYTPPAADGSRPGVFWAVVKDPRAYDVTGMVTLYLHEGRPGHHFHLALLQELGLPNFRKFGGNNAYTEGWALYSETLGREMGLFEKPENYFGHLNDELLRAVRLVVDTGMHSKGWTREQAITYMRENLGYPEADARAQIERYMVWPGQALGYKIGALKIVELRARAQKALGAKFSLPKFHEVVLEDGTVPLSLLEAKVNRWIEAGRKL